MKAKKWKIVEKFKVYLPAHGHEAQEIGEIVRYRCVYGDTVRLHLHGQPEKAFDSVFCALSDVRKIYPDAYADH